jgi:DNA-binding Xre family transcriptional regulator
MPAFPKYGRIVCRLDEIMTERRLSNTDLAKMSGLSRQTVTLWRDNSPESYSERALARLCAALKVEPGYLLIHVNRATYLAAKLNVSHPWHKYTK